ncbi:MAG: helix-turn-helix transcriptional regulator [Chitinophagaceae bacterium]|nr:helix-turn-helix transcriptional regulator [Chitinophagaceae bacterium]
MKSEKIKKIRKEYHLTQEEFAYKLGISRDTLLNAEKGLRISKYTEKLIEEFLLMQKNSTHNTQKSNVERNDNAINGNSANFSMHQYEQMNLALLANVSTSSTTLALVVEVLSKVADKPIHEVKELAQKILNDKSNQFAQMLQIML